MQNLTCIVCPIGCSLEVNDDDKENLSVSGYKCARGAAYALEEIRAPKRVVTATCKINNSSTDTDKIFITINAIHRVPVKTASPCLRDKIPALLTDIYKANVSLPVKVGDIIIKNWNGENIDVIATRTIN